MKELIFVISPNKIQTIYTEDVNLRELGTISCQRASNVEMEEEEWVARLAEDIGSFKRGQEIGRSKKRNKAIEEEIAWLQKNILWETPI
jgi:hypothetical protein